MPYDKKANNRTTPDNIQELANVRLTVDAFLQHLANSGVYMMRVQEGCIQATHLPRKHLDELKAQFYNLVIDQIFADKTSFAIYQSLRDTSKLEAEVKDKDPSNTTF